MALEAGDDKLAKICGIIAADESRHEIAYQRIIDEVKKRSGRSGVGVCGYDEETNYHAGALDGRWSTQGENGERFV